MDLRRYYLGLVLLLVFFSLRSSQEDTVACSRAEAIAYSIIFAPHGLRAADMADSTTKLKSIFPIDISFYESSNPPRTTNLFRARQLTDTTFEGETQWISFSVEFLSGPPSACFFQTINGFTM
jgi:hypothetical protein